MTSRTTTAHLQALTDRLNRLTGSPMLPYATCDVTGRYKAQIGAYKLSQAYGGVSLHRIVNEGGGCTDVLGCGHVPKRELGEMMGAYVLGLEHGRSLEKELQEKAK